MAQPLEGAARGLGHVRMAHGQTAHVRLVDHRVHPGRAQGTVLVPVEVGIDHDRLGHEGRAVAVVHVQVAAAHGIAEQRVVPDQVADDLHRVGVQQQLVGVEAMALFGREGAVHAVAVGLPRADLGQVAVPYAALHVRQVEARDLVRAGLVVEAQLHPGRMLRPKGEIRALAIVVRAQTGAAADIAIEGDGRGVVFHQAVFPWAARRGCRSQ